MGSIPTRCTKDIMRETKARKTFKKRLGQANHFLITTLVGLDGIESGIITEKPEDFHTSWNPKNLKSSASRSRGFVLKSFLGWAVESLEMYMVELNRKPKELYSEKFTQIYSNAGQSIYKKVVGVGEEAGVRASLIGLMEVLITWRNHVFHYGIDNEIRPCSLVTLSTNKEAVKDEFCGLDIDIMKETWESGRDFTFKEAASLIRATQKFVEELDEFVLNHLDIDRYVKEILEGEFKNNAQKIQKYKSLPNDKRCRFIKSLVLNNAGKSITETSLTDNAILAYSEHITEKIDDWSR